MEPLVEVAVGASVTPGASFVIAAGINTAGARATYELLDNAGALYASGNGISLVEIPISSNRKILNTEALVTIPSAVPVVSKVDKFRMVWTLLDSNDNPIGSYVESFSIRPATVHPFGVPDIVECLIDEARLVAVLPATGDARVSIFCGNQALWSSPVAATVPSPVYEGRFYEYTVPDTYDLGVREALSPYTVLWEYRDSVTNELISEDGYLYHVNPVILQAAKELQSMVHRVRSQARMPETTIDLNVCIHFLKMGADMFNSMGMPTYFTMTNAQGALRSYWVACAQVLLLQSQYLVEAERSFTMNGQSVNLDFDITSHYEGMASTKQSWLDQYVPDFKKNLHRRGDIGGPGNMTAYRNNNVGAVGLALSPVSNFYWLRYPRFRGW